MRVGATKWCDIRGAGKEAQLRARKAITDVWGSDDIKKMHRGSVDAGRINWNSATTEMVIINSEGRFYHFLLYKMSSFLRHFLGFRHLDDVLDGNIFSVPSQGLRVGDKERKVERKNIEFSGWCF